MAGWPNPAWNEWTRGRPAGCRPARARRRAPAPARRRRAPAAAGGRGRPRDADWSGDGTERTRPWPRGPRAGVRRRDDAWGADGKAGFVGLAAPVGSDGRHPSIHPEGGKCWDAWDVGRGTWDVGRGTWDVG